MRIALGASIGAALTLAALGGCSKPADKAADATAATADAAATAPADAAAPGGAVSPPPSAQNEAVNTDGNTSDTSVAAASNSFTEGQARGHIEEAGYTDVTGLTKSPEGLWTAKAKKGGKTVDVALDFKGAVTAK